MFERYSEKARRVIFFGRYEASQFGSPVIETEHILLGVLREDKALTNRFLRSHAAVESIRQEIEARTTIREKTSTSVDLPLSDECKRVLAHAAEEADQLNHKHIGTEHLMLGLLREEKSFAAEILKGRGLQLDSFREELAKTPHEPSAPAPAATTAPPGLLSSDLTQLALDGRLDPVVARDFEIDCVIEVLSRRHKNNPILIGERGVGKTAIVEGLAQRIADGAAPPSLAGKRILAISPELLGNWSGARHSFDELMKLFASLTEPAQVIFFIDGLQGLSSPSAAGAIDPGSILKFALLYAGVQCIGAGSADDFASTSLSMPWLAECFRAIHIRPLDETGAFAVLQARKSSFEKFHEVTYSDEAIEFAAQSSSRYLPSSPLPAKALELLDAAGALVKLRRSPDSGETAEVKKRLRFIAQRLAASIANHEFEKARFYSDEERKERENLRALQERLQPEDTASAVVGKKEIEEVIERWVSYPYSS